MPHHVISIRRPSELFYTDALRSGGEQKAGIFVVVADRFVPGTAYRFRPSQFDGRLAIRRAHFWLGAGAMIYLIFVSLTGCAIIFEHELYRILSPDPPVVLQGASRLDVAALKAMLAMRYAEDAVVGIWDRRLSGGIVIEVWLDGSGGVKRRLVNPQTGDDLGEAQPLSLRALELLRRAHVAVLAGESGRFVNAAGAAVLIMLSVSSLFMRHHKSRRRETGKREARKLDTRKATRKSRNMIRGALIYHGVVGAAAWMFGLLWGITGVCFAMPWAMSQILGPAQDAVLEWLYALHTGAAGGMAMRIVWALSALSLSFLAITGILMSWKRILGHLLGHPVLRRMPISY